MEKFGLLVKVVFWAILAGLLSANAVGLEDLRSTHSTVLEPMLGHVDRVQPGIKAFLDTADLLASFPPGLQQRSFLRASKNGVRAICKKAGYVCAVTASQGLQLKRLEEKAFKQLDYPEFQALKDDPTSMAFAYQKYVDEGELLEFGSWVLLIFGSDNRSGLPDSKLTSLEPPVYLPDGREFKTWEVPLKFSKTFYVSRSHPKACDDNPGTKDLPFKTINRAAQILQPGQRVIVNSGVYRERVRPACGGTGPERMISYEAAPGAKVIIKGSRILKTRWVRSRQTESSDSQNVWMTKLDEDVFENYNPFKLVNLSEEQIDKCMPWAVSQKGKLALTLKRGLIFQNGKRLRQLTGYEALADTPGSYWVAPNGLRIHAHPYGSIDPNNAEWEFTTQDYIFAPEQFNLGYIRVKGFIIEHSGNGFPRPQEGALSTLRGHHWIIEDNIVRQCNSLGIDIGSQFATSGPPLAQGGVHIVRRNTITDCGIGGIEGPGIYNTLIENNVLRRNCWHNAERIWECAAIKTHNNNNVLIRRNLVFDTRYGAGIWIDFDNVNSRCSQNVIINTGSIIHGGIFVEASLYPNMVDNNFIWTSTSCGIRCQTGCKTSIFHNMIGNCTNAAIILNDGDRRIRGKNNPGGSHKVFNNILVNNGWNIEFRSAYNWADYNLFGKTNQPGPLRIMETKQDMELNCWQEAFGYDLHSSQVDIKAEFNPETLELAWSVQGDVPQCHTVEGITHDFWGRSRPGKTTAAGPFGDAPAKTARIKVDPR